MTEHLYANITTKSSTNACWLPSKAKKCESKSPSASAFLCTLRRSSSGHGFMNLGDDSVLRSSGFGNRVVDYRWLSAEEVQYFIDLLPLGTDLGQAKEGRPKVADGRNVADMAQIMQQDPANLFHMRQGSSCDRPQTLRRFANEALKESLSDPSLERYDRESCLKIDFLHRKQVSFPCLQTSRNSPS